MIRKLILSVFSVVFLIMLFAYLRPTPEQPFERLYQDVDKKIVSSLTNFRKKYPLKSLTFGSSAVWEYLSLGKGDDTILFLHGMAGDYDIFWQVIEPLASTYKIIAVTYPPIDSLEKTADGIWKILDREKSGPVHVVGTSLGGYIGEYLIAERPERIQSCVIANSFPPNDIIEKDNRLIGRIVPYLPEWVIMGALKKNTIKEIFPAAGHHELVKAFLLEQAYGKMSKADVISRYHLVIDKFKPANPEKSGVPVMIIESDNDPLVAESLRRMLKDTYPSAQVVTFENAGHFPYLNNSEKYGLTLAAFFSRTKTDKAVQK